MAVNVAFITPTASYPTVAEITSVGTTWQAIAPPVLEGGMYWEVQSSSALYLSWGSASDDGGSVANRHKVTTTAGEARSYAITPEVGKRAHLLVAAQSGTATINVMLGRS